MKKPFYLEIQKEIAGKGECKIDYDLEIWDKQHIEKIFGKV
jgi:hypothetical protein